MRIAEQRPSSIFIDYAPAKENLLIPGIKFGIYRPKKLLNNEELLTNDDGGKKEIKTANGKPLTAQGIERRTGVEKRYVANQTETPFSMGFAAAEEALLKTEGRINALIVSTSYPTGKDISLEILTALAKKYPERFEKTVVYRPVHTACSGFTKSLAFIKEYEEEFIGKNVLLIATEKYSTYLHDLSEYGANYDPALSRTIFSDGAVAMSFMYGRDLEIIDILEKDFSKEKNANCIRMPIDTNLFKGNHLTIPIPLPTTGMFEQDGKDVIELMNKQIPELVKRILGRTLVRKMLHRTKLEPSQIKMVIPHQAGVHILNWLTKFLSEYHIYKDYQEGNWSSASIPKALMKAMQNGEIKREDIAVLAGFGAGPFASIAVVKFGQSEKLDLNKKHKPKFNLLRKYSSTISE